MMDRILGRYEPYFYAVLRIVAGVMFAMHGTQKLLGWPGDQPPVELGSLMGVAGIIELVAGVMIAIGLFTGTAAVIAFVEMIVAYFKAHLPGGPIPLLNGGELALLYGFLFLYMAARGSGIWSVDPLFVRARDEVRERNRVTV
jgi:putative oxidoreductase